MARNIALSNKTKQLMAKLANMQSLPPILVAAEQKSIIEQADLVAFLKARPQGDKKNEFLLESLSASLLKDLHDTLLDKKEQHKKKVINWSNKLKYWLLAIAGIIFLVAKVLMVLPQCWKCLHSRQQPFWLRAQSFHCLQLLYFVPLIWLKLRKI
ncbi:hypothetical protein [Legionella tunisiensis]|uniref:hypothetical protein n=1 Tax=Legionella tunisiensis TaxID=1034944 RepID=UPI000301D49C|nr:hypothetical protein [Legionella tunisiensis]